MYWLIATITGIALDLFFKRVHVEGEVPAQGPILIVANHFNALLDPVMVTRLAERKVRFLGKEPLFRTPVLKHLVKGMGTLPVYRAMDGADTSRNTEMFSAVYAALSEGEAVCVFPEGISHNEPQLQRLKTGAARMALGAEADNDFSLGLKIVPVGLVYRDKRELRSLVATFVGPPVEVSEYQDAYAGDEREAVRALTAHINDALRNITLNMERWDDMPLLELAERIWANDKGHRVRRVNRLAAAMHELREIEPDRLDALRARVNELKTRMDELGMRPGHLEVRFSADRVLSFLLRNLLAIVVGLPVAVLGAVCFTVPYLLAREVPRRMSIDVDEISSFGLLAGIFLFPLWTAGMAAGIYWLLGWPAALASVILLPLAGRYTLHFIRRRKASWRDIKVFLSFGRSRSIRRSIRAESEQVREEIEALEQIVLSHRNQVAAAENA